MTNKVIGIHKGSKTKYGKSDYNLGTFLRHPLVDLKYGPKVSKNNNYYFI